MFQCLILGDSIAYGLSTVLKGCLTVAKIGMSSAWILSHAPSGHFDRVYVSSGSNDPGNYHLVDNLKATRNKYLDTREFVWVLPVNTHARSAVYQAKLSQDKVVGFVPGGDNVHPKSYQALKNSVGG